LYALSPWLSLANYGSITIHESILSQPQSAWGDKYDSKIP
jgi:hypothetical protein